MKLASKVHRVYVDAAAYKKASCLHVFCALLQILLMLHYTLTFFSCLTYIHCVLAHLL